MCVLHTRPAGATGEKQRSEAALRWGILEAALATCGTQDTHSPGSQEREVQSPGVPLLFSVSSEWSDLTLGQRQLLSGPQFPFKLLERTFLRWVCAYTHFLSCRCVGEEHTILNVPLGIKDKALSSWWGRVALNLWRNVDPVGKPILKNVPTPHQKRKRQHLIVSFAYNLRQSLDR